MKTKNTPRKRLVKIFMAYALAGAALFSTGYGLQKAYDKMHPHIPAPVVHYLPPPAAQGTGH